VFAFSGTVGADGALGVVRKSSGIWDADTDDASNKKPHATIESAIPILRRGSSGDDVRELQRHLMNLGYDLGRHGADGSFGGDTQRAVEAFQRDNGLSVTGAVGPITWGTLAVRILPNDPNAIYYIYGNDQVAHAERNIADMRERGRIVYGINMRDSFGMFTGVWNALPNTVDTVVMNFHSWSDELALDRPRGSMRISDLNSKTIDTLILNTCNNAHQDVPDNLVNQFFANNTIRQIVGFDGAHQRNGTPGLGATTVVGRHWFNHYARRITVNGERVPREPLGMMHYINGLNGVGVPVNIGTTYTSVHDQLTGIGK
jgi:peptidoglycan hydrolase-like protein with peptidoglycan-binding domain